MIKKFAELLAKMRLAEDRANHIVWCLVVFVVAYQLSLYFGTCQNNAKGNAFLASAATAFLIEGLQGLANRKAASKFTIEWRDVGAGLVGAVLGYFS